MPDESESRSARLLKAISSAYDAGDLVVSDRLPGEAIRREINDGAEQSDVGSYFSILNEVILLWRYRAHYYLSASAANREAALDYKFAVRATRNASSIRLLCGRGLDVDALMLLRNLYELSLLRCKILLEPSIRSEYENASSPKAAKEFWHRHVKRGRLRTFVEKRVKERGTPWLGLVNDGANLDQIETVSGLTSHPTYIAKSIDALDDFRTLEGFCISSPVAASKFTLQCAILCLCLPGIIELSHAPHYETPDLMDQLNPYPPPKKRTLWNNYINCFPKVEFGLVILAFASNEPRDTLNDAQLMPQQAFSQGQGRREG